MSLLRLEVISITQGAFTLGCSCCFGMVLNSQSKFETASTEAARAELASHCPLLTALWTRNLEDFMHPVLALPSIRQLLGVAIGEPCLTCQSKVFWPGLGRQTMPVLAVLLSQRYPKIKVGVIEEYYSVKACCCLVQNQDSDFTAFRNAWFTGS